MFVATHTLMTSIVMINRLTHFKWQFFVQFSFVASPNEVLRFRNNGAVLVQIAALSISQLCNQNQSIDDIDSSETYVTIFEMKKHKQGKLGGDRESMRLQESSKKERERGGRERERTRDTRSERGNKNKWVKLRFEELRYLQQPRIGIDSHSCWSPPLVWGYLLCCYFVLYLIIWLKIRHCCWSPPLNLQLSVMFCFVIF